MEGSASRASSIRWKILRQALLRSRTDEESQLGIEKISRKASAGGFKLIPFQVVDRGTQTLKDPEAKGPGSVRDVVVRYRLPVHESPEMFLTRASSSIS